MLTKKHPIMPRFRTSWTVYGAGWGHVEEHPELRHAVNGLSLKFDEERSKGNELVVGYEGDFASESELSQSRRSVPEFLKMFFYLAKKVPVHVNYDGFSQLTENNRWSITAMRCVRYGSLPPGDDQADLGLTFSEVQSIAWDVVSSTAHREILELLIEVESFLKKGNDRVAMMIASLAGDTLANLLGAPVRDAWRRKVQWLINASGETLSEEQVDNIIHARHHVAHDADCPLPRSMIEAVCTLRRLCRKALVNDIQTQRS